MDAIDQCNNYLTSGGLFNPDLAIHDNVRDLIIVCRNQLIEQKAEIERLQESIKIQANAMKTLHNNETTEINRLRKKEYEANFAIKTLDSERKANEILTKENDRLMQLLETIKKMN